MHTPDDFDDLDLSSDRHAVATAINPALSGAKLAPRATTRPRPVRKGEAEVGELAAPVKLLGLDIVGYKRIRAVQFELTETGLTIVGGGNAQGKSSSLEAITCLLGGGRHIPDIPVHADSPRATIAGDLVDADGRRYHVKRVIRPDRTTHLEITRDDGTTVQRAQEFLDAMKGVLWFDPCAVLEQSDKDLAESVRRLVGLDFSGLDRDRARIFEQRTMVGRDRDRAKGHAESMPYHEDAPAEELSASEIAEALAEANAKNLELAERQGRLQSGRQKLAMLRSQQADAEARAEELNRRMEELLRQMDVARAEAVAKADEADAYGARVEEFAAKLAGQQPFDIASLAARMTEVDAVNRLVRDNVERSRAFDRLAQHEAEYDGMTAQIASIDAEKRRQLAEVRMPVEGLKFNEDGSVLMFGEYPLTQASSAEQIRVAVAMAMEMSGGLKVCLVDEGEKLDHSQLRLLDKAVRDAGGQVVMARVSMGDECTVVIEDGAVAQAVAA